MSAVEQFPAPHTIREFDRLAVITIQGGGIYGLNLLGQLRHVIEEQRITPVALAGTSAGAIVATLYWAGLKPREIEEVFVERAPEDVLKNPDESDLAQLLGEFEPPRTPFTFGSFIKVKEQLKRLLQRVGEEVSPEEVGWLGRQRRRLFTPVRLVATAGQILRAYWRLEPHFQNRGLFTGTKLGKLIDDKIREGLAKRGYDTTELKRHRVLRFANVRKLIESQNSKPAPPALYLTTTNVMTGELTLINSIEKQFDNVVIAEAVRASGGFPMAFRPIPVDGAPTGWYVDGGVMSNFPAWVYADAFRQTLLKSEQYKGFAARPWVHIGLRLGEDPAVERNSQTPLAFLRSLGEIVTGRVRDELEDRLSRLLSRSHVVRQPADRLGKKVPKNLLDIHLLTKEVVRDMVESGLQYAKERLGHLQFWLPDEACVAYQLHSLIAQVVQIFGLKNNGEKNWWFRTNVAMPFRTRLIRRYQVGMDDDADRDLSLHWAGGISGFCYTRRHPLISNLGKIQELARRGELRPQKLFNVTSEEWAKVRPDRTWLASIPIFDPYGSYPRDHTSSLRAGGDDLTGYHYLDLESPFDGAIFGTVGLDIGWKDVSKVGRKDWVAEWYKQADLDPDPPKQLNNPRIRAVIAVMQGVALTLGRLFADSFAPSRKTP